MLHIQLENLLFSFFINLFVLFYLFYLWLHWVFFAACGLFSGCGEWGLLFVEVRGLPLIAVASLVGAWPLGTWASVVVARRL